VVPQRHRRDRRPRVGGLPGFRPRAHGLPLRRAEYHSQVRRRPLSRS
jgi:hypothetical protein